MEFTVNPTPLQDLVVAETRPISDARGSLARLFCAESLRQVIGNRQIVQINQSVTRATGAIRGLHFQYPPHAEMKMVRCLRGKVFDVAVDLRSESPTLLQWYGEELTPENSKMLVIPEGFAHGFQVLEADSEMLYFHTAPYRPGHEGGVLCDDPRLAVEWPLACTDISERDLRHRSIDGNFSGIAL